MGGVQLPPTLEIQGWIFGTGQSKSGKNRQHDRVFKRQKIAPVNYSVSTNHFQTAVGILAPDWTEKILPCVVTRQC